MEWRSRVGLIGLVYLLYLIAAIIGLVLSALGDDARPGIIIALTCSSLHFLTATLGQVVGDRIALRGAVLHVSLLADWVTAAALGMSSVMVGRASAKDEQAVAIAACILIAVAQLFCAAKSFIFLVRLCTAYPPVGPLRSSHPHRCSVLACVSVCAGRRKV